MGTIIKFGFIVLSIYFCLLIKSNVSMHFKHKLIYLILLSIIVNISINFNIYENSNVFIQSLTAVLFIYDMFFYNKRTSDESLNIRNMNLCLNIIILYIAFQAAFLKIYNYQLWCCNLVNFINIKLIMLMFCNFKKYEYKTKNIVSIIIIFSIINAAVAVLQYKTGLILVNSKDAASQIRTFSTVKRVSGISGADNAAGTLAVILFPVILYYFDKKKTLTSLAVFLSNILFLIYTFTRIGYVAAVVEVLIYIRYSINFKSLKSIVSSTLKTFFLSLIMLFLYNKYFDFFYLHIYLERGNTQDDRFIQFAKAMKAFLACPIFGVGAGQYNDYLLDKLRIFDLHVIHSQLINFLVEEGAVLFIILLFFNIYLLILLIKKYKNRIELKYIIMLFTGNLISSNFNPNQYYALNIYLYYFIMFGLLFSQDEIPKVVDEKTRDG